MPPKIRELKSSLSKASFNKRSGKGSYTVWKHSSLPGIEINIQIKQVRQALKRLEGK